jgi:GT2 family glycosyltransferase
MTVPEFAEQPILCVLSYNGIGVLRDALASALAIRDRFHNIVLVDNASTDGSAAMVRSEFPQIEIVSVPVNHGPAGGRNFGIKAATGDLILFVDNDVALTASCVDELLRALRDNPAAVLATPAVVYAHQQDTIQYDGAESHCLGLQALLDENVKIKDVPPGTRRVGSMVSCCFLLDRRRMPCPDYFDESFFIYFEDHDFGSRLRLLGRDVLSVPSAVCYHGKGMEGLSIRAMGSYSSARVYHLIRNRWLFVLKNFSGRTILLLTPLYLVYEGAQLLIALKKGWLRHWVAAAWWVCTHLSQVLAQRRKIQKLRRVPDREILVGGRIPFRQELATSGLERFARRVLDALVTGYWKAVAPLI